MVSGREGGMAGEVSKTGTQLLALINLYEDGLLKKLKMIDDITIEYEIHENFINMNCAEDEKILLKKMSEKIGMSGTLQEDTREKSTVDGYLVLNDLWFEFWYKDMNELGISRGYTYKNTSKIVFALSILTASLTFGVFFSIFLSFIPFIGKFIASILLLPVLILFAIGYGIATQVLIHIDISWAINNHSQAAILIFTFLSWFAWFIIFSQSMSKLNLKLTPLGLEVVRKLEGYKKYLKSVDRNRLSFSFNRESDLARNHTSFSWLGVFGMIKDEHWDQWYEVAKLEENNATKTSPNVSI